MLFGFGVSGGGGGGVNSLVVTSFFAGVGVTVMYTYSFTGSGVFCGCGGSNSPSITAPAMPNMAKSATAIKLPNEAAATVPPIHFANVEKREGGKAVAKLTV